MSSGPRPCLRLARTEPHAHLAVPATFALAVSLFAGCNHRPRSMRALAQRIPPSFDAAAVVDSVVRTRASQESLRIPWTRTALVPSGQFDVNVWARSASTHTLLDERGAGAVPVSEARFLWGGGNLYMFFYAADLDLRVKTKRHDGPIWNDDGVVVEFQSGGGRKYVIAMTPTGVVSDAICPEGADLGDEHCDLRWESGARVGTDCDGTINTLGDFDEEWAVEMVLPLASIGVEKPFENRRIPFSLRRCEVNYEGTRTCGRWGGGEGGGVLVLEAP